MIKQIMDATAPHKLIPNENHAHFLLLPQIVIVIDAIVEIFNISSTSFYDNSLTDGIYQPHSQYQRLY